MLLKIVCRISADYQVNTHTSFSPNSSTTLFLALSKNQDGCCCSIDWEIGNV